MLFTSADNPQGAGSCDGSISPPLQINYAKTINNTQYLRPDFPKNWHILTLYRP